MWSSLFASVLLSVLTLTHTVPAPFSVSVKCDSYGVVVEWMSTGLSEDADFVLEIKTDFPKNDKNVTTKLNRYNISDQLLDTGYNRYFVKVKARDDGKESEFAESKVFSFSHLRPANITCKLEFPTVQLTAEDGQLKVKFTNPVQLYRNTPALRKLQKTDLLKYSLTSDEVENEATCSHDSDICESSMSFPEKQEKYCVTISGMIRQTLVLGRKEPYCYLGTLSPGPPLSMYLSIVLGSLAVFVFSILAAMCLMVGVKKKIKKKYLTMLPEFLESNLPHTHLFMPHPEPLEEKPRLEPTVKIPKQYNSTDLIQASTALLETFDNSNILTGNTSSEDMFRSSGSSKQEVNSSQDNTYGYRTDLSGSSLSEGYDRPHRLIEISPGDRVKHYGS